VHLDAHQLRLCYRIVTPVNFTRRYDTTFYLVALDDDAQAVNLNYGESDNFIWISPLEALNL
jgi:hypothetical protein